MQAQGPASYDVLRTAPYNELSSSKRLLIPLQWRPENNWIDLLQSVFTQQAIDQPVIEVDVRLVHAFDSTHVRN